MSTADEWEVESMWEGRLSRKWYTQRTVKLEIKAKLTGANIVASEMREGPEG